MIIHLLQADGAAKCGVNVYQVWQTNKRKISNKYFLSSENILEVNCKRCLNNGDKSESVALTENYLGKIFSCSWGYDMTINDYAKVIKQNGACLTLQICAAHVENDNGMGGGKSWAGEVDPNGKIFIIRQVRTKSGHTHFTKAQGQYWSLWDGQKDYYNTWD